MTSFLPIPPCLPDGFYRARLDGRTDTLRCTGGAWFNRFGVAVPTPEEYAPVERGTSA